LEKKKRTVGMQEMCLQNDSQEWNSNGKQQVTIQVLVCGNALNDKHQKKFFSKSKNGTSSITIVINQFGK